MKIFKKRVALGLTIGLLSAGTLCGNESFANTKSSGRNHVEQSVVSNLRVRTGPSTSSTIKYTLSNGKDIVNGNVGTQKWEGGNYRLWRNYSYPSRGYKGYSRSATGWVCVSQSGKKYVGNTMKVKVLTSGEYTYYNTALTQKDTSRLYKKGSVLARESHPQYRDLTHSTSNLNAWNVYKPGSGSRWINGWKVNAFK